MPGSGVKADSMTHAFRGLASALVVALTLLSAASAHAQATAAAEALFNQGRDAMAAGDYEAACKRFRESDRLDPAVGTKFNLADCEEKRGRLATAWEMFRTVIAQLPENDERLPIAKQRAGALEPRLSKLTLRLAAGAPAGTTVKDGQVELGSGSFDLPLPLDPGKHRLLVNAPGHASRSFEITLLPGETRQLEIGPGAANGAAPLAPPITESPAPPADHGDTGEPGGGSSRTLGFVLGGVGVAGLAVGSIAGVMVLGKKSTADEHCGPVDCDQEGVNANDSGRTLGVVSTIGFVVGAASLGAGAYLILTSDSQRRTGTALGTSFVPGGALLHTARHW
jgi:hypothetical protein